MTVLSISYMTCTYTHLENLLEADYRSEESESKSHESQDESGWFSGNRALFSLPLDPPTRGGTHSSGFPTRSQSAGTFHPSGSRQVNQHVRRWSSACLRSKATRDDRPRGASQPDAPSPAGSEGRERRNQSGSNASLFLQIL